MLVEMMSPLTSHATFYQKEFGYAFRDTMEDTVMLQIESFHSHQVGGDAADVRAVVASTTQQANDTLANWKKSGLVNS